MISKLSFHLILHLRMLGLLEIYKSNQEEYLVGGGGLEEFFVQGYVYLG